jgi:hypothetical protein
LKMEALCSFVASVGCLSPGYIAVYPWGRNSLVYRCPSALLDLWEGQRLLTSSQRKFAKILLTASASICLPLSSCKISRVTEHISMKYYIGEF